MVVRTEYYENTILYHFYWMAQSLKTVARKSAKYRLNLVSVQEVRWTENSVSRKVVYNILTEFGHSITHMDTSNMHFCTTTMFC
jgi:hypothetical protein